MSITNCYYHCITTITMYGYRYYCRLLCQGLAFFWLHLWSTRSQFRRWNRPDTKNEFPPNEGTPSRLDPGRCGVEKLSVGRSAVVRTLIWTTLVNPDVEGTSMPWCATKLWNPEKHLFRIDPLPWALNF